MDTIKIFSPATVANVSCGFDVLGFCLDSVGDDMIIRKTKSKGITISKIEGYSLPLDPEENVAGVAGLAILKAAQVNFGFDIEIHKRIKPGSGIGSSSASASGTVYAINKLLGKPFNKTQLTAFAMKGEAVASGNEHADNIAPGLFGGFTLVKSLNPLEIIELPTPKELYVTIVHPQIEVKTSEARALLPKDISLKKGMAQWANVGSLVHGLHTSDYGLISRSLVDNIVEPHRKQLIPYFDEAKSLAIQSGALGVGISGSGPSIFALSQGEIKSKQVAKAFQNVYKSTTIDFKIYTSKINSQGIKTIS
ncbi:homoserine kinase [Mangrovimonas cancribranchiae]|uniref:Homoserine kinase n=1 Tax=Mangrovimonas cancribranchiae TaxID=3080055 RepID=A0AAU6P0I0_9FLAO